MNLGLLDLPAPLFDLLDAALAALALPALLRVMLYAAASAWLGMKLYRRCSDQAALGALRRAVQASQRTLALHDGDFGELRVLIRRNLVLSLRQVGMSLRPALLASLPLLFVMPWLSNRFAFEAPLPGTSIDVCVQPADAANLHWLPPAAAVPNGAGCWHVTAPLATTTVQLIDAQNQSLLRLPDAYGSAIKHKHTGLNYLIGNPGGYLADDASVQVIRIDLPPRELIAFGPTWIRGWEGSFFLTALLISLWLKWRWRLS